MLFQINKSVVSLIVLVFFALANPLVASNVGFTRIADTSTVVPGGTETFAGFSPPALEQGDVAFLGFCDSSGISGIYTRIGGTWGVAADTTTYVPGTSELFTSMGSPSLDGGNVAFAGQGANFGTKGIYTTVGDGLNKVVDNHDTPPAGGTFNNFGHPTLNGQNVGFMASGQTGYQAVYAKIDDTLNLVADTTTVMPGHTETFAVFSDGQSVPISGDAIAFHGRESRTGVGQSGIYTTIGGSLIPVVDIDTPVPGVPGATFWSFSAPVMSGDQIAFIANYGVGEAWKSAILTWSDGTLEVLYDNNTVMPGRTETFVGFLSLSLDAGAIAFTAIVPGSYYDGLYTNVGGTLTKIIEPGDTLDGKIVDYLFIGPEALSGDQIAFTAVFTDESNGIYIVTVPEPATMVLLMTAVLGLLTRGTRKPGR